MAHDTETFFIPPRPPLSVPLKGYLVKEEGERLWVQDQQGTWVIDSKDVIGRGEWAGAEDSRFSGEPGIFHIRDGAEIHEVRTVKIKAAVDWPLAIADKTRGSAVVGAAQVDTLAAQKSSEIQASDYECVPSYSMAPDKTGWGIRIHRDDWQLV